MVCRSNNDACHVIGKGMEVRSKKGFKNELSPSQLRLGNADLSRTTHLGS